MYTHGTFAVKKALILNHWIFTFYDVEFLKRHPSANLVGKTDVVSQLVSQL